MTISKPYKRTVRQFKDGSYQTRHINLPGYSTSSIEYVRAFAIIQKDIQELFEYVEPSDTNLGAFSYRIHSLFVRTCIEIEANLKAVLLENGYQNSGNMTMNDYKKCEHSHKLSSYYVKMPVWRGNQHTYRPFEAWANGSALHWYQDYNAAKHDRTNDFVKANFRNLLCATSGLVAILSAQFMAEEFLPHAQALVFAGTLDGYQDAVCGYFRVKYPDNLPMAERYEFDYDLLKLESEPFQNFPY